MRRLIPFLLLIPTVTWGGSYFPGPIQVNNNAGTPNNVGYSSGNSSAPVNVLNTITVTPSGNINVNNTNVTSTITFNGTQNVSASLVNQATTTFDAAFPSNGVAIGGNGPTGKFQTIEVAVDSSQVVTAFINPSSNTVSQSGNWNVNATNPSTMTVYQAGIWGASVTFNGTQNVQLQSGTNAVGTVVVSTNGVSASTINVVNAPGTTLSISGSISATNTNISTVAYDASMIAQGVAIAGQGPTGKAQTFVVDTSSNIGMYLTNISTVAGQFADNGAAAGTNRETTTPGIYQNTPLNGTAATQGRNAALSVGTDGNLWVATQPGLRPAGFHVSTGTITSAASATDISCLYGNATNKVLVLGMRVSGTQTTAGIVPLVIVKRSAADVGAFSTMTVVADDSNMNVGVSSAVWFTANPTVGTAVGVVSTYNLGVMATGTATPNDIWVSPASWRMRPIVLNAVTQGLCVNLNSTTVTGGSFAVEYEYEEITSITP